MGIILVTISFLATLWRLAYQRVKVGGIQAAFLQTCVGYGVIIVLSTEVFSLFFQLNFKWFFLFWAVMAAINIARLFAIRTRLKQPSNLLVNPKSIYANFSAKSLADKIAAVGVLTILSICLVTAFMSPPNNYDSMTYHMPRIIYWIQN